MKTKYYKGLSCAYISLPVAQRLALSLSMLLQPTQEKRRYSYLHSGDAERGWDTCAFWCHVKANECYMQTQPLSLAVILLYILSSN